MKRKLNVVFVLMALALLGIIIFQIYWTTNAYTVNKEKFDTNVNIAMQKAMDDCKKDYFDSIRRVLIKRLSPPEMVIKVDTLPQPSIGISQSYDILLVHNNILIGEPFSISKSLLDFYSKTVVNKTSLPEVVTEVSFYVPELMRRITSTLLSVDYGFQMVTIGDLEKDHPEFITKAIKDMRLGGFMLNAKAPDSLDHPAAYYKEQRDLAIEKYLKNEPFNNSFIFDNKNRPAIKFPVSGIGIKRPAPITTKKPVVVTSPNIRRYRAQVITMPPNYREADSIKLSGYYKKELQKMNIYAPFQLVINKKATAPDTSNMHFSETDEQSYKYHGFKVFGMGEGEFFIRAKFLNPQYNVLRNMLATLILSVILVLFTVFCFNYIRITFIEQKRLADLKDDFINNMTHELKTPIATITVAIEGMQSFNALNDPEKTERYLQTSRNELARLNDLVTKVLDIAAFENKGVDLVKEKINVNGIVNEVIASEKAKSVKNINISYVKDDAIDSIYADKIHFRNVLLNLVDNAIKYSSETVDIAISCHKSGNDMLISVKDNGIGIPSSHINLVFEKFHRVPTGNVHNVKGTGLGLSYVKYIVEAHGGTINVKSEIDKGTEFIVCLPLSNG